MADRKQQVTVIRSKGGPLGLGLKEAASYRDLILLLTKRNLTVKYKQTILGPLWLVITPLVSSLVSAFVFGDIAKIESGNVPYFAFYFVAFVLWSYFASCLTGTASTFTGNAGLFRKVWFPRLAVPLSTLLSSLVRCGVHFAMAVVVLMVYAYGFGAPVRPVWSMVWLLPLLFILAAALALGVGALLSSLTAKYRDLSKLVGLGVDAWKYLTPVVYSISSVPAALSTVMLVNPMAPVIEALRYIMLGSGGAIHGWFLLLSTAETLFILVVGLAVFHRTERNFIDTV